MSAILRVETALLSSFLAFLMMANEFLDERVASVLMEQAFLHECETSLEEFKTQLSFLI